MGVLVKRTVNHDDHDETNGGNDDDKKRRSLAWESD